MSVIKKVTLSESSAPVAKMLLGQLQEAEGYKAKVYSMLLHFHAPVSQPLRIYTVSKDVFLLLGTLSESAREWLAHIVWTELEGRSGTVQVHADKSRQGALLAVLIAGEGLLTLHLSKAT